MKNEIRNVKTETCYTDNLTILTILRTNTANATVRAKTVENCENRVKKVKIDMKRFQNHELSVLKLMRACCMYWTIHLLGCGWVGGGKMGKSNI